jgi:hypothetical protein
MNRQNDPHYLIAEQYRDASNLNARIQIHRRFSTNTYGWTRWLFDIIGAAAGPDVLELGCGQGNLWAQNLGRVPADWRITLTDFSPGMDIGRHEPVRRNPSGFLRCGGQSLLAKVINGPFNISLGFLKGRSAVHDAGPCPLSQVFYQFH